MLEIIHGLLFEERDTILVGKLKADTVSYEVCVELSMSAL